MELWRILALIQEGDGMSQTRKRSPIDEKLTLRQVRARVGEIKSVKPIEGKGSGSAVRSGKDSKPGAGKVQR